MAKELKCGHCNSKNLRTTSQKGIMECRDCGGSTDLNGNRFAARFLGTAAGGLLAGLTLGLLPEEAQDQIADGIGGVFEDWFS